ncbi:hypothetical protein FOL47_005139 [Perkinsus chesapeaki]|uniref:Peptidase A1 domain-containing protein n=1 Tax=Perkinsus chesapeaki TaxID=330153 RepID=A0A7J6LYQ1_PERCH|nr:hypothetical protein FOL47_005139 [Perkinsus chesapeaki]
MWINVLFPFITGISVAVGDRKVLRQGAVRIYDLSVAKTSPPRVYLYTTTWLGGQRQMNTIDTCSPYYINLKRTTFEQIAGFCACQGLFKCYDCPEPCQSIDHPISANFPDRRSVSIFRRSAELKFGGAKFRDIIFGLIYGFGEGAIVDPPVVLGLAPTNGEDEWYPSIMKQLTTSPSTPVKENVFALYLRPARSALKQVAELLLGGGDASLYKEPLQFVPVLRRTREEKASWSVMLKAVQIGVESKIDVNGAVVLDTGSDYISVSRYKIFKLFRSIEHEASKAAGKEVSISYNALRKAYQVDCQYREHMPTLHFMLAGQSKDVPLSISFESYVSEDVPREFCSVLVRNIYFGSWRLSHSMLVGNYMEFRNATVGIAKVK